jgi:hypothetical protein
MGCETSRQKHMRKLKELSSNKLDERIIENIMMNTHCK